MASGLRRLARCAGMALLASSSRMAVLPMGRAAMSSTSKSRDSPSWERRDPSRTMTRLLRSQHMCSSRTYSEPREDPANAPKIGKISFIGAGKMAEAMIGGMLCHGIQAPESFCIHDVWEAACKRICDKYPGVTRAKTLAKLTQDADIIVLAVKPQECSKMLADLHAAMSSDEGRMKEKAVLVSIMTGIPVSWLQEQSGVARIVRAMPNTPVSIQEGCVVWFPTNEVEEPQLKAVAGMFSAIGDHVMVQDERYLDMSTAISGSGPYYLYLTMETMVDAGVHMGLPRSMSERLVKQTLLGSCMYALSSNKSITTLRNDIISPGGTTASAQYTLERGGFRATVYDAIWAAYRRSLELGGENSNVGPGRSSTAVLRTMEFSGDNDYSHAMRPWDLNTDNESHQERVDLSGTFPRRNPNFRP